MFRAGGHAGGDDLKMSLNAKTLVVERMCCE